MSSSNPSAAVVNSKGILGQQISEIFREGGVIVTDFSTEKDAADSNQRFDYAVIFLDEKVSTSKALNDFGNKYIYVVPVSSGPKKIRELVEAENIRVAIIADPVDQLSGTFTSETLSATLNNRRIIVNPEESNLLYLYRMIELAQAIVHLLFTSEKRSISWLIPRPISLTSYLANLRLVGINPPEVFIDPNYKRSRSEIILPEGVPYWSTPTPPELLIQENLEAMKISPPPIGQNPSSRAESLTGLPATPNQQGLEFIKKRHTDFSRKIITVAIVCLISLGLSFPAILFASSLQMLIPISFLTKGKISEAVMISNFAYLQLVLLDQSLVIARPLAKAFFLSGPLQEFSKITSSLESIAYAEFTLTRLADQTQKWYQNEASPDSLPNLEIDAQAAQSALTIASIEISSQLSWLTGLPVIGGKLSKIEALVPQLRQSLINYQKTLPHFYDLGGFSQPRTYLILFQNNMELRPTGGFIGSFGLVTVKNGKIADLEVHDIYTADGQLKGHVEPPSPIKNILGEANWYFRDSNWDPDFPTSALRAQWFLEKELGRSVDGTIAITLNLAQSILSLTGPVVLSDFQEEISADNLYERAQYHAEANSFPGSTQKQDFLGSLARTLIEKLKKLPSHKYPDFLTAIQAAVVQKDIQIYSINPAAQKTFSELGWAGEIAPDVSCTVPNCYSDSLLVVDSNLGVNKGNYFLRKKFTESISVDPFGQINHQLTAEFQNTARSSNWPAGNYRSYLRLYLPLGSEVGGVEVRDGTSGLVTKISQTDLTTEHRKTVLGFTLEVPIKESRIVTVFYKSPFVIDLTQKGAYLFSWHRQAGTAPDPISWSFNTPTAIQIAAAPGDGIFDIPSSVRYNRNLTQDLSFQIDLVQRQ